MGNVDVNDRKLTLIDVKKISAAKEVQRQANCSYEIKRCSKCERPRDNGHETLYPLCLHRQMLGEISCTINRLLEVK